MLNIIQIPVLSDNYVFIVHDELTSSTAVVDPAVSQPIIEELEQRGWTLDIILNTHHHLDHVGGNLALKEHFGCKIVGAEADKARIPGIDQCVVEGHEVAFGHNAFQVLEVAGHTKGHIAYQIESHLFCGDTLFSLGCGRLFEGTPEQMVSSLGKFLKLDDSTSIHCAHEYTLANARFTDFAAKQFSLEGFREDFQGIYKEIQKRRERDEPTVPTQLGFERQWNLFLRVISDYSQAGYSDPISCFRDLRKLKDDFS